MSARWHRAAVPNCLLGTVKHWTQGTARVSGRAVTAHADADGAAVIGPH